MEILASTVGWLTGLFLLACAIFFLKVSRLKPQSVDTVFLPAGGTDLHCSGLTREHGMVASDDGESLKPQSKQSVSRYDIFS